MAISFRSTHYTILILKKNVNDLKINFYDYQLDLLLKNYILTKKGN